MDRHIVYAGQVPLETDLLYVAKQGYVALSQLAQDVLGNSSQLAGFAIGYPGGLALTVGPGRIYAADQALDSAAYSSLGTDASTLLKQGVLALGVTLSASAFPPPAASAESINYLVQVGFLEQDTDTTVLPYYNAGNPAVAWSGPSGSSIAQARRRADTAVVSVVAGVAAPTGSQATPAPSAGCVGAYVVTVANGQSAITSANVAIYSSASFVGLAPLNSPSFSGYPAAPTATLGANNLQLANTAYVQSMAGSASAGIAMSGNQTLTVAQLGANIQFYGSSSATWTYPAMSTIPLNGMGYHIYNQGTASLTIAVAGGDAFHIPSGLVSSIVLLPGDDVVFSNRGNVAGTHEADIVGGSYAATYSGAISSLVATATAGLIYDNLADNNASDTSGNSVSLTLPGTPVSWTALNGIPITFRHSSWNNNGAMTVSINGLSGSKAIVHGDGTPIEAGEMPAHCMATIVYNSDGSKNCFEVVTVATSVLNAAWPVGSVYVSVNTTNPATLFGFGSWEQIAQGQFLVGVGTGTDANGVSQTFGAGANSGEYAHTLTVAEMPSHSHTMTGGNAGSGSVVAQGSGAYTAPATENTGGGGAHNNNPPSFGVYLWKRTA